ncbi:conserved hypothetical protein [Pseudoalteromonas sp. 3J6]|uniref:putative phage abortive infection protein n=1 Tax=Pseudoalteromonas sp. 3J6 TaxID=649161 RepID=UPI00177916BA|nr:putative phage abortive infection protein [Pseudoalteromonas sp. 3J6]CAD2224832.1 conserved hypothetical protein [Pseudoalteromonas sp. 3J6]
MNRGEKKEPKNSKELTNSNNTEKNNSQKRFTINIFIVVGIAALAAISALGIFIFYFKLGFATKISDWGAVGDFFGGVLNPTFALLSLILIAYTLMQNKKALEQSEKAIDQGTKAIEQNEKALQVSNIELELTRNELANSSKALEEQASLLAVQSFETTFFNMLELHIKNLNRIKLSTSEINQTICDKFELGLTLNKTEYFEGVTAIKLLIQIIDNPPVDSLKNKNAQIAQSLSTFSHIYPKNGHLISTYFIHLYQILKLIDNTQFSYQYKKNYSNILRSQFTNQELSLLILNCLCPIMDNGKLRKLVIEFEVLEHLDICYLEEQNRFRANNPKIDFTIDNIERFIKFDENSKLVKSAFGKNRKMHEYFERKHFLRD